ncbi:hypothetical protein [Brachybacterium sp. p3-SID957]|uniref:hypothetical protein n=1 Tax=Brachybacterium sp. p3-SID957 TaxID=2916049 RepID=UPI00223BBDF0|nr:hypothetical protein [Brachybacterium sp. p3-SID957]MCT1775172.1 hypothetical protein [Brachybacterium sp. p3-SID957]
MSRAVADAHPTAYRRPSRKLQWMTVVVGFLLFVLLLVETALLVLGSTATAVSIWKPPADADAQMMAMIGSAVALVLGGLTMLLAGACIGRYRALVKLAALLLFLGAFLRLVLPVVYYSLSSAGVYTRLTFFGARLDGQLGEILLNLHWYAMVPALLLTLLGLLGLVLIAPKRLPVAEQTGRTDDPRYPHSAEAPRPTGERRPVDGTRAEQSTALDTDRPQPSDRTPADGSGSTADHRDR